MKQKPYNNRLLDIGTTLFNTRNSTINQRNKSLPKQDRLLVLRIHVKQKMPTKKRHQCRVGKAGTS